MNPSITFTLFFILLVTSCSNEPMAKKQLVNLPNTPETVSKQWQFYLDHNELEKVATLSTASTKEWLAENKELFLNDKQLYKTEFLTMTCAIEDEKAICNFTIREEGELIEDFFLLKKIDGQWLVDIEEDTTSFELDEEIFREMERELKLD